MPITGEGQRLLYDALARLLGGWVTVTCEIVDDEGEPTEEVVWMRSMYAVVNDDRVWCLPPFEVTPVLRPGKYVRVALVVRTDALVPFLQLELPVSVTHGDTVNVPAWRVDLSFAGTSDIQVI
jgi:hypothetical protein